MATTSWIKTFLLLLLCQLFYCQQNETTIKNHIKDIRKMLFETRGYDSKMRPTLNFTALTNITLNFGILYIQNLDFQKGFLESTVFIGLRWRDEHLAWSADQFGGLVEIRVAASEVFTPDIVLVNRVDNDDDVVRRSAGGHADLILLSSGLLAWAIPVSVKSTCSVDLTEWPYDEQSCHYRFASWFYNGNAMNLVSNSDKVTGGLFHESPQWAMVGNECVGSREARGENDFFPEVNCYLRLKRRSANYRYTVYLPVICALLLNLLSFFLDVAGRLRFQLVSIAFGSLLLELLYLGVKLGSVSSLGQPKVVIYLGQMVVFVACTLLWSTFASHLVASGHLEVPPKMIKVIEPLSPWLVSNDVEAMSLAKLANAGDQASSFPATQHQKTMPNNVMFVQVVDKILFALFLLLAIVLHN